MVVNLLQWIKPNPHNTTISWESKKLSFYLDFATMIVLCTLQFFYNHSRRMGQGTNGMKIK